MKTPILSALIAAALVTAPAIASAQESDATTYRFDGSFEDATFAVENAIISEGLVIDHVSHVGEMLARTGKTVSQLRQQVYAITGRLYSIEDNAPATPEMLTMGELSALPTHTPVTSCGV